MIWIWLVILLSVILFVKKFWKKVSINYASNFPDIPAPGKIQPFKRKRIAVSERYKKRRWWKKNRLYVVICSALVVWLVSTHTIIVYSNRLWNLQPNEVGDSFGMVNALFSGLAFAFLVYNSWMQRLELEMQRKELKAQRESQILQLKAMLDANTLDRKVKSNSVRPIIKLTGFSKSGLYYYFFIEVLNNPIRIHRVDADPFSFSESKFNYEFEQGLILEDSKCTISVWDAFDVGFHRINVRIVDVIGNVYWYMIKKVDEKEEYDLSLVSIS